MISCCYRSDATTLQLGDHLDRDNDDIQADDLGTNNEVLPGGFEDGEAAKPAAILQTTDVISAPIIILTPSPKKEQVELRSPPPDVPKTIPSSWQSPAPPRTPTTVHFSPLDAEGKPLNRPSPPSAVSLELPDSPLPVPAACPPIPVLTHQQQVNLRNGPVMKRPAAQGKGRGAAGKGGRGREIPQEVALDPAPDHDDQQDSDKDAKSTRAGKGKSKANPVQPEQEKESTTRKGKGRGKKDSASVEQAQEKEGKAKQGKGKGKKERNDKMQGKGNDKKDPDLPEDSKRRKTESLPPKSNPSAASKATHKGGEGRSQAE